MSESASIHIQKKVKKTWSYAAIQALLGLIKKRGLVAQLDACRQKNRWIFEDLTNRLAEEGHTFTWEQVKNQWKYLKRAYYRIKKPLMTSGMAANVCHWPPFSQLDELLGTRPRTAALVTEAEGPEGTAGVAGQTQSEDAVDSIIVSDHEGSSTTFDSRGRSRQRMSKHKRKRSESIEDRLLSLMDEDRKLRREVLNAIQREGQADREMMMQLMSSITQAVEKTRRGRRSCAAYGCSNTRPSQQKLSFHRSPNPNSDRRRYLAWLNAVKTKRADFQPPNEYFHLCSDHFLPSCFNPISEIHKQVGYRTQLSLRPTAVPTIFLDSSDILKRRLTEESALLKLQSVRNRDVSSKTSYEGRPNLGIQSEEEFLTSEEQQFSNPKSFGDKAVQVGKPSRHIRSENVEMKSFGCQVGVSYLRPPCTWTFTLPYDGSDIVLPKDSPKKDALKSKYKEGSQRYIWTFPPLRRCSYGVFTNKSPVKDECEEANEKSGECANKSDSRTIKIEPGL